MARWSEGEPVTTLRTPHRVNPRIEGTEVSTGGRGKKRFSSVSVEGKEYNLFVEPAAEFTTPSAEVLDSLMDNAVKLRDSTESADEARRLASFANKNRDAVRDSVLSVIESSPNLRGIASESRDTKLTATPTQGNVEYDLSKLKKSLRSKKRFMKATSRRVIVEVTPRKDMDPELLRATIDAALNSLGSRVARRASVTTVWIVDDGVVADMVKSGEVTLFEGTRRVDQGFSIKAERFGKPAKK